MSSALKLLQSKVYGAKPYKGFSLVPHGNHEIFNFKLVKNKMYKEGVKSSLKRVILIELKDEVLFLPEYFAIPFNDDDAKVDELNTDGVKRYLFFGGKKSQ